MGGGNAARQLGEAEAQEQEIAGLGNFYLSTGALSSSQPARPQMAPISKAAARQAQQFTIHSEFPTPKGGGAIT